MLNTLGVLLIFTVQESHGNVSIKRFLNDLIGSLVTLK